MNKLKIINDPIYGFVRIPYMLILDIIQHPYFQRLRHISQMGLSFMVYPGATHTRFHHSIGAMHLMQTAISELRYKGVEITEEEEKGALLAILLHDIGHGPFSHALEYLLFDNISHEKISIALMETLNNEFDNKLSTAISIFKGKHPKKFLSELISSQIDVDRLDYLKRDSFYSGVIEGQINSERLIKMMNVIDNKLVIEEKGIYSIEKYLISRRLMYWQVYYHKTSLFLEMALAKTLQRVKELIRNNKEVFLDDNLSFLFKSKQKKIDKISLEIYTKLDDNDIMYHLKKWIEHPDFILSYLSNMIVNRKKLNKVIISKDKFLNDFIDSVKIKCLKKFPVSKNELEYLVFQSDITQLAYQQKSNPVLLLQKNGKTIEFSKASDKLNIEALSQIVTKYFLSYPSF